MARLARSGGKTAGADLDLDLPALQDWFVALAEFRVKAIVVLGPGPYEPSEHREVVAVHPKSCSHAAAALARSDAYGVPWRSSDAPLAAWRRLVGLHAQDEEWVRLWVERGALFMVRVDFPTAFNQGFECFIFCGRPDLGADALMRIAYSALGRWPLLHTQIAATRYGISARELQVLIATAEGLTTKEAGERIGLAERTVAFHLQSVQAKLGASNRPAAIQRACSLGLL